MIISYRTERPGVQRLKALGAIAIQAEFSSQESVMTFIAQLKEHTDSLRAIIHNASEWLAENESSIGE